VWRPICTVEPFVWTCLSIFYALRVNPPWKHKMFSTRQAVQLTARWYLAPRLPPLSRLTSASCLSMTTTMMWIWTEELLFITGRTLELVFRVGCMTRCWSVLRHFGTSAELSRTLRHRCRTVLRHFGTGAEVSWCRSVLGPKCLDTDQSRIQYGYIFLEGSADHG